MTPKAKKILAVTGIVVVIGSVVGYFMWKHKKDTQNENKPPLDDTGATANDGNAPVNTGGGGSIKPKGTGTTTTNTSPVNTAPSIVAGKFIKGQKLWAKGSTYAYDYPSFTSKVLGVVRGKTSGSIGMFEKMSSDGKGWAYGTFRYTPTGGREVAGVAWVLASNLTNVAP